MQNELIDSIWNLRTNIKLAAGENLPVVMSVTSTVKGEGKTTIALHLAYAFVKGGQNVLLVDANLRRPGLRQHLNIRDCAGIAEFLKGEKQLNEVIHHTDDRLIDIIPCCTVQPNPLKILDSPSTKLKELVNLTKSNYNFIILDTCSVEDGSDPLVISTLVDKIIYVLASEYISAQRIKNAISFLQQSNSEKIGVVLNKVREINLY